MQSLRTPIKVILLQIIVCLILSGAAWSETFTGKLVHVVDGDTVDVMFDGKARRIRLAEIDCPESNQAYGNAAKRFVLDRAAGQEVTVQGKTTDRYGRLVGDIILPNGKNLNHELVIAGLAWWYRKYSDDEAIGRMEEEARGKRAGLWQDPEAAAPWEFRKMR